MTLLLPAADLVVREAVDAMLDGRIRPGAGSDISFATRSSRYRVIHGVLREATDASLVGARFVGWLFDGGPQPRLAERWESDARAVLLDELKGQIVVTSITRVHVSNALPAGDGVELPATQLDGSGFPPRASTLHGLAAIDPEPEPMRPAAPAPAAGAPAAPPPAWSQQPSQLIKRTIPPSPPIPGRQNTPIPGGQAASARVPTPLHPGARTAPMGVAVPPARPSTPLGLGPRTMLGMSAATMPPAPPSATTAPASAPATAAQAAAPAGEQAAPQPTAAPVVPPPPPTIPEKRDAPLPQFDLDDLDDMPTRADPSPPTRHLAGTEGMEEVSAELDIDPPSSEDGASIIPLIPRP